MSVISGLLLGLVLGSIVGYLLILGKNKVNSKVLDTLKTDLTESDSERLALFNIKDTKNLPLNISEQDKEYLLTEFIKSNKRLVPYGNVVDDKDYLYPKMKFSVYLSNKGVLYHDVPGAHMRYDFTLDKAEMKELLGSIHSESYTLSLMDGPYRVLDELTGDYTEFKDNPLNVSIEVPLKLFIKTN